MIGKYFRVRTAVGMMGLLALIILPVFQAGCAGAWPSDVSAEDNNPFYKDKVATLKIEMAPEDWDFCLEHAFEEQYVRADIWFDDELIPDVGVRPKGNSSLGQAVGFDSPRIPMAVDFNLFNRARTFYGVKKVFLNNGWSDPTLIREVLAYELFAKMEIPSPRASLVDVWVNDTHLGVYTMAEVVDASFVARHFDNPNGNLYKPELVAARLDWTEADAYRNINTGPFAMDIERHDPVLYTNIGGAPLIDLLRATGQEDLVAAYEEIESPLGNFSRGLPPTRMPETLLEAVALKTNENRADYSALFRFLEVLNNEPDKTFMEEIEKVLDVDQTLRYIAVSAVILHLDNYIGVGHNNYLYEVDGVFTIIPWDLNMAFGTFNCGIDKEGLINYYIDEPTSSRMDRFPLVDRLLTQPQYLKKYREYVREFNEKYFRPEIMLARINEAAELIRPYAEADNEKFYTTEDCIRCLVEDFRPPDPFLGWQAGGPIPQMPWPNPLKISCLKKRFDINGIWDLFSIELDDEDLEYIESCLDEDEFTQFKRSMFGPLGSPQKPRMRGFGPNALGLKPFVVERYKSVRDQLTGTRPSHGRQGTGNGVTKGMCAGGF
ncbi:CotH kinase family protein [Chloroflexota bacterium]